MTAGAAEGYDLKRRDAHLARLARKLAFLAGRIGFHFRFTSITSRIVVVNIFGLVVLVLGILYLNQFRAGLIETQVESLLAQGKIIAGAIAEKGAVENERANFGPDYYPLATDGFDPEAGAIGFSLNPETITSLIRRMAKLTGMRARVYDRDGVLLVDSQRLYASGQVLRLDLPPVADEKPSWIVSAWRWVRLKLSGRDLPLYRDIGAENGKAYTVVKIALQGEPSKLVGVTEKTETIVTVGVPIQRMGRSVLGAIMLTSPEGEIDATLDKERGAIMSMAFLVLLVTFVLSVFMAGTIAGPMHRLATAAERVRVSVRSREPIPDYTHRSDEIGHLSGALRDMTSSLYRRMDAIESFAADVAHELKNPLTSLRSAAEALPIVKAEADRARLIEIIQHDVRRMNRLITDISNASRLDAEMSREAGVPVDIAKLLETNCSILNDVHRGDTPEIVLRVDAPTPREPDRKKPARAKQPAAPESPFLVNGHESRLSQVVNNIVDNAISFSPKDGRIYVSARRLRKAKEIEILIEDEGPGIAPENFEKIFNRFYTDRPAHEAFGQNSGLGLHISRQIVMAHGGRIWAENRHSPHAGRGGGEAKQDRIFGARFVIRLPAV